MGQFKRTLQNWQRDIQRVWGRLRTFHRIALAITLSMVAIYGTRRSVLDPLQAEIIKKQDDLDKKDIPQVIPSFEEDEEVQRLQMILENLQEKCPLWQKRKEHAISHRPQINPDNYSRVVREFDALIGAAGMVLQSMSERLKEEDKAADDPAVRQEVPLSVRTYQYELAGTFASISRYLEQLKAFHYPARISRVEVRGQETPPDQAVSLRREPLITMRFRLELFYHEK